MHYPRSDSNWPEAGSDPKPEDYSSDPTGWHYVKHRTSAAAFEGIWVVRAAAPARLAYQRREYISDPVDRQDSSVNRNGRIVGLRTLCLSGWEGYIAVGWY